MNKRINIPSGWQEVKLENSGLKVIDGDRGKKYPNGNDFSNSGYCLFMNAGNVTSSGFLFKENIFITKEKDEELRKGKLKRGDLVLTTRGSIGNIAYYDKNILFDHLRINSGMVIIRNSDRYIDTDFIYKLFRSPKFLKQINKISFGSAQPQLTVSDINKLKILLPPLQEQKAIADILEKWDEVIEKTSKLITEKKKRFEWVRTELLDQVKNKNWQISRLSKISTIKKGEQLNRSELEGFGNYPAWNGGINPSGYTDKWNTLENTITISEGGNSCGFVNYCEQKFWCGGHCYSLLDVNKKIDPEFLYFFLKSKEKSIMRLRVGSGLPNIQKKDIDKLEVRYPELPQQKQIAKTLNIAKKEITLLEEILAKYKNQKKGLMQNLLTGKLRTNNKMECK